LESKNKIEKTKNIALFEDDNNENNDKSKTFIVQNVVSSSNSLFDSLDQPLKNIASDNKTESSHSYVSDYSNVTKISSDSTNSLSSNSPSDFVPASSSSSSTSLTVSLYYSVISISLDFSSVIKSYSSSINRVSSNQNSLSSISSTSTPSTSSQISLETNKSSIDSSTNPVDIKDKKKLQENDDIESHDLIFQTSIEFFNLSPVSTSSTIPTNPSYTKIKSTNYPHSYTIFLPFICAHAKSLIPSSLANLSVSSSSPTSSKFHLFMSSLNNSFKNTQHLHMDYSSSRSEVAVKERLSVSSKSDALSLAPPPQTNPLPKFLLLVNAEQPKPSTDDALLPYSSSNFSHASTVSSSISTLGWNNPVTTKIMERYGICYFAYVYFLLVQFHILFLIIIRLQLIHY
jgi:hypothetical protein